MGNVSKVKQLTVTAHSELLQALRRGEIRIHRAWRWSKASPEKQREALRLYQSERGVKKTIWTLVSRHRSRSSPPVPDLSSLTVAGLVRRLSAIESSTLGAVSVAVIRAPGTPVFLTEELTMPDSLWPIFQQNRSRGNTAMGESQIWRSRAGYGGRSTPSAAV